MRIARIQGQNPVNSSTFCPIKTTTQNHLQANTLLWLDFVCDNLMHPCNTLTGEPNPEHGSARLVEGGVAGDLRHAAAARHASARPHGQPRPVVDQNTIM